MDYLWSPWRYRYLTEARPEQGCIFCNMAERRGGDRDDRQDLIVHRGLFNFVVLNRYPYTSGHLMVVPYAHTDRLTGITDEAAAELMQLVREAERHLQQTYKPNGLNIGMNMGESAGAGIAGHVHMHVLPRWVGDSNFMTTIGETRVLPEELDETWQRLSTAFATVR